MIRSYIICVSCLLAILLTSEDTFAQQRSLMRRQSVGMAGAAISTSLPGKDISFAIQSSTGQASPIGGQSADGIVLRQGFIQPIQRGIGSVSKGSFEAEVFPNPFTDEFLVKISVPADFSIQVFDPAGRALYTERFQAGTEAHINLSHFSSGIYILRISAASQYFTERVLKL